MPSFTITQKIHPISTRYVVVDDAGTEVCHVRKKKFKLREELVLWADSDETRPWARIKARSVVDFGGVYDVLDESERPVGAIKRYGIKSMVRSKWDVLDTSGGVLAEVHEDSIALALLRRVMNLPVPIEYGFHTPNGLIGTHKRRFGIRDVYDLQVDGVDPRLAIAQGLALDLLEGR